jgi:probable O-glycosylation ligase (exosortase A-associated)
VAPAWSWFWWVEFAKALVVSFMIVLHTRDHSRFRLVLMVIAFSLGLEGAKQGWAQFVRNPGAVNMNIHPMLGDNNGVAVGMFMLAPIFSALAATASSQRAKWLYNFFWVGVILRGVTTYSRGGFLSGAALTGVYVLRSQRRLRAIAAVVVVGALLLPVLPDDFWNRMSTITAESDNRDASAEGRLHMWAVAWRMAADHPFTGVGFNAYNRAYDAYDSSRGAFGEERAVHSSWFGALAEMGYPGLVCLVAAVVLGLWNAQRVMRVARRTPALGNLLPYALAVQASLIVYCVGGTFINTQYSEMMWHLLALSIALRNIAFEPVPSETPALAPGETMVGPTVASGGAIPARSSLV